MTNLEAIYAFRKQTANIKNPLPELNVIKFRQDLTNELKQIIDVNVEVFSVESSITNCLTMYVNKRTVQEHIGIPDGLGLLSMINNHQIFSSKIPSQKDTVITKENGKVKISSSEGVYIPIFVLGKLEQITSRQELMAILLHEVGHHFEGIYRKLFLPIMMIQVLIINPLLTLAGSLAVHPGFASLAPFTMLIISLFYLYTSARTLQKLEYHADSFATQCGYGNELKSALTKLTKYLRSGAKSRNVLVNLLRMLLTPIMRIFKSHPETEDRVKAINEEMQMITPKQITQICNIVRMNLV